MGSRSCCCWFIPNSVLEICEEQELDCAKGSLAVRGEGGFLLFFSSGLGELRNRFVIKVPQRNNTFDLLRDEGPVQSPAFSLLPLTWCSCKSLGGRKWLLGASASAGEKGPTAAKPNLFLPIATKRRSSVSTFLCFNSLESERFASSGSSTSLPWAPSEPQKPPIGPVVD